MFDTVRAHQRVLLAVILLLILPAFVLFGVSGYERMFGPSEEVAVVGGEKISRQSLDLAHRQQLDQLREMAGGQLDTALFDTPQARAQTLENLITQQALLVQARKEKILVSDETVRKTIASNPALQGPNGTFDYDHYRMVLAQQGMSPAGYEAQLRQELALQMLGGSLQSSVIVPQTVLDRLYEVLEERRTVRVRRLDAKDYEAGIEPTDEQLQAYYDGHASRYELPEVVDVETLVLDRSAISVPTPSEDELKAYYQQNHARFVQPEQRRASHILILAEGDEKARAAAKAKAEELHARVKADPSTFEAIAKADSQDPGSAAEGGDLGYFARDMMTAAFADAAFGMAEGEIAGPVESEYGYHIIKLTGIKGSGEKPFDEVRDEIAKTWREQETARRFNEEAEQFNNFVYEQADTLQPAADRFKLKIETTRDVTRRASPGSEAEPGSPLADQRFRDALFSANALESKRNVEAMEIQPGRVAAARVIAHRPATRQPLDKVRDEVRAAVILEEAGKRAVAEGEKLLAAYREGKGRGEGKSEGKDGPGADFGQPMTVTRTNPGTLSAEAARAVFELAPAPLPAFTGAGRATTSVTPQGQVSPSGYQIVELEKVEAAQTGPEADQRRQLFGQQLQRQAGQAATQAYVEAVRARTPIERHPGRL